MVGARARKRSLALTSESAYIIFGVCDIDSELNLAENDLEDIEPATTGKDHAPAESAGREAVCWAQAIRHDSVSIRLAKSITLGL